MSKLQFPNVPTILINFPVPGMLNRLKPILIKISHQQTLHPHNPLKRMCFFNILFPFSLVCRLSWRANMLAWAQRVLKPINPYLEQYLFHPWTTRKHTNQKKTHTNNQPHSEKIVVSTRPYIMATDCQPKWMLFPHILFFSFLWTTPALSQPNKIPYCP